MNDQLLKIRISEVWNREGRSEELALIEVPSHSAHLSVMNWIKQHRPDLSLAVNLDAHGYHAVAVYS